TSSFIQDKMGLDEKIDHLFGIATGWFVDLIFYQIPITEEVQVFWVLIPLILGALFFTLYFNFPNIRYFGLATKIIRGDYDQKMKYDTSVDISTDIAGDDHSGEVSHFQALTAALSATVGLGNIAGVAIAVVIGGAGATFWMIVAGFLGMSSKFVECTLGVKYR